LDNHSSDGNVPNGTVVRKRDSGYGFIKPQDGGKDIFFHAQSTLGISFDDLIEGEVVWFDVEIGPKGLAAANVRREDDYKNIADTERVEDKIDGLKNKEEYFRNICIDIITDATCKLLKAIAVFPNSLHEIEHRDLERCIAEAFAGLGFDSELTPGSKDGGKDVVVRFKDHEKEKIYSIEIKHWRSGRQPGKKHIENFIDVIARENHDGGLFISSSGFSDSTIHVTTEYYTSSVKLGNKNKIIGLAQSYTKIKNGLWRKISPSRSVFFNDTL
jgi:cold shock CspA family protein